MAKQIEEVQAEISDLLGSRIQPGVQVSEKTHITRDLALDSVSVMDFVMDIEDHFDISIPLDQIAKVETVGDLSSVVAVLLKDKG